jgi:hypothetical protein
MSSPYVRNYRVQVHQRKASLDTMIDQHVPTFTSVDEFVHKFCGNRKFPIKKARQCTFVFCERSLHYFVYFVASNKKRNFVGCNKKGAFCPRVGPGPGPGWTLGLKMDNFEPSGS